MDDFERRLCDQTKQLYIIKTFTMSQVNPKIFFYNTAFSVQLPYHTLSVTPFKTWWIFKEGGNNGTVQRTQHNTQRG